MGNRSGHKRNNPSAELERPHAWRRSTPQNAVPFGGFEKGRSPCNIQDSFVASDADCPLSKETFGTTLPPAPVGAEITAMEISMPDEARLTPTRFLWMQVRCVMELVSRTSIACTVK